MRERVGAVATWLPFDLHPEYPPEGIPRAHLNARYGERLHAHVRELFEAAGLDYNPPPEVVPNTRAALRLAELARDLGRHRETHDRLMDAYWAEATDIGDRDVLRGLAADVGLPPERADAVLAGDAYLDRVVESTRQALAIGVTGVPGFLLDRRLLVLGAQPRAVFEGALERLGDPS